MTKSLWLLVGLLFAAPGLARGDKVIPQIADGPGYVTKLDLVNISIDQPIANYQLSFYHQDGSKWALATTLGTGSSFTLALGPRETLRVETLGQSNPVTAGYAVLYDNESQSSVLSKDFVVGISVYYAVSNSTGPTETVSVPSAEPTTVGVFPVDIDDSKGIYTGFAIVNLSPNPNSITMTLETKGPTETAQTTFTLAVGQQRAEFLHEKLFPGLKQFRGSVEFYSGDPNPGPIAILALLQTGTAYGPQYATLVPTSIESLRRNGYVYLPQATTEDNPIMPLDVDLLTVDYFRNSSEDEGYSWDLTYEYTATDHTKRSLKTWNGAALAVLGDMTNSTNFDGVSLPYLKSLTYSENPIDLSDSSGNMHEGFGWAVRTDLGNYAKIRILQIYTATDANNKSYKNLVLEVNLYR